MTGGAATVSFPFVLTVLEATEQWSIFVANSGRSDRYHAVAFEATGSTREVICQEMVVSGLVGRPPGGRRGDLKLMDKRGIV